MTNFSDWVVITGDRMCVLPPDTKVQVMWRNEDVEHAEQYNKVEQVRCCVEDGVWFESLFAYRIPIEPVWKTVEYDAYVSEGYGGDSAILSKYGYGARNESVPVKAKVTYVDGKLVSGSWKVVE